MDRLLDTNEIAEYLNVKPITIRRKAAKGQIPATRVGNRFRFDRSQIDKWLFKRSTENHAQILVVDDEPIVVNFIRDTLKTYGYQVTTTLSSVEALPIINQKRFDLIFLDLVMPDLDGSELFKRIREIDENVPVIIVTGYPDSEIMAKAIEHGPFSIIKKPFVADDILNIVRSMNITKNL